MPGIYIHIPFCSQACHYCDFHFSTSLKNKDAFLQALRKEIELRKSYLPAGSPVETIYLGGGTPSLLDRDELNRLFEQLQKNFSIAPGAEITLEANPDDLTPKKIKELSETPVNRLSIGIQSFYDEDLAWMNRAHTAQQADASVKGAQDKGFENITIDLMYGLPTLTDEKWKSNLNKAFALEVPHISAYCLTVESRTPLADMVRKKKVRAVNDQESIAQFTTMLDEMKVHGFIQYEISNFCREGLYSRHNSNYWKGIPYLGLGPSAHSFNGQSRQWNVSNNVKYIQAMENSAPEFEKEELTTSQRYNEYILTSLRTMWGTDLSYIAGSFGKEYLANCEQESIVHLGNGDLKREGNTLFLTDKGKLLADAIASDLFITESN